MCVLCMVYSFPPVAEICARLAGKFCQQLTTVKSVAYGMVCLNLLYFPSSQQGWEERGSGAVNSPYYYTTFLRARGMEGGCVPSPCRKQGILEFRLSFFLFTVQKKNNKEERHALASDPKEHRKHHGEDYAGTSQSYRA